MIKKQKKFNSVFIKIFIYTFLLVLLVSLSGIFLFAQQFLSFYRAEQLRQLNYNYSSLITAIINRTNNSEDILALAREFADSNQSFRFLIRERESGKILFTTGNLADLPENALVQGFRLNFSANPDIQQLNFISTMDTTLLRRTEIIDMENQFSSGETAQTERINIGNYYLTGYNPDSAVIDYGDIIKRSFIAVVLMLVIAVLGAFLFARKVTKPLEDEIVRRKNMEENQRLFFSAASHELKTPIASARALVEGMIAGVGDYNDHPKYLRECLRTLDTQGKLVTEILDIVKLSDKETDYSVDSFDLAQLGNIILAEFRSIVEQKNITVYGEFPECIIKTDRLLLQKVLSNIIANAVQNTPEGESIIIESEKKKNLHLRITNTGVQIPQEILSQVFEPFFRQDTARTGGAKSGLGLTIVKKALDRMKCPFALENTSSGAAFHVELPQN